ncbi:hypothetical protein STXM2123_1435 [Streptomyces sp. F-3]|nr:hypothetical protein STXM2123_1435 [Streptomyces sp. F-3]
MVRGRAGGVMSDAQKTAADAVPDPSALSREPAGRGRFDGLRSRCGGPDPPASVCCRPPPAATGHRARPAAAGRRSFRVLPGRRAASRAVLAFPGLLHGAVACRAAAGPASPAWSGPPGGATLGR